jgi:hypothetical protein
LNTLGQALGIGLALQGAAAGADGFGGGEVSPMGLGERCDEIVRLIDETLAAFGIEPGDTPPAVPRPKPGVATVRSLTSPAPPPDRAAAGF